MLGKTNFQNELERRRNAAGNFQNAKGPNYRNAVTESEGIRTITARVALISTTTTGTARIFGYLYDPTETTNTANNVTVTIDEADSGSANSHPMFKRSLPQQQIEIEGLKIDAASASQLTQILTKKMADVLGSQYQLSFNPATARKASDNQSLFLDIPGYKLILTQEVYVEVPVVASATYIFFVKRVLDTSNFLTKDAITKQFSSGF